MRTKNRETKTCDECGWEFPAVLPHHDVQINLVRRVLCGGCCAARCQQQHAKPETPRTPLRNSAWPLVQTPPNKVPAVDHCAACGDALLADESELCQPCAASATCQHGRDLFAETCPDEECKL